MSAIAEPPTPSTAREMVDAGARIGALLPDDWRRGVEVTRIPDGLLVRLLDVKGGRHAFELRRLRPDERAFVRGRQLGCSYRVDDAQGIGAEAAVDTYRRLLHEIVAHEPEILPLLDEPPPSLPGPSSPATDASAPPRSPSVAGPTTGSGRHVFLREGQLLARLVPTAARAGLRTAVKRFLDEEFGGGEAGQPANQLIVYFENRCEQACAFCTEPLARDRPGHRLYELALRGQSLARLDLVGVGLFDLLVDEMARRDPSPTLVVTGNDWALHPRLNRMLARLEREHRVPLRFQGPSTKLAARTLAQRIARLPTLERITFTLLAADPARHDAITGAMGSGARVQQAVTHLRELGAPLRVNVVLTTPTIDDLPTLLAWLAAREIDVSLLAFIPDRLDDAPMGRWDPALTMPQPRAVRAALDRHLATGSDTVRQLFGVPLCAVPPSLRARTFREWESPGKEPMTFPRACGACALRPACSGVPARYAARYGDEGLAPEGASSRVT